MDNKVTWRSLAGDGN